MVLAVIFNAVIWVSCVRNRPQNAASYAQMPFSVLDCRCLQPALRAATGHSTVLVWHRRFKKSKFLSYYLARRLSWTSWCRQEAGFKLTAHSP